MSVVARFGGILITFALMFGFAVLGFATSQPGLLFIGLLCLWPLLWAVTAWTVRGLRDHYALVPKGPISPNLAPRERRQRPAVTTEEY